MISATHFKSLRDPQGKRFSTSWEKLVTRLSTPSVSAIKEDVPGLSLATFRDDYRRLANVERVFAIGLDLDEGVAWGPVRERFARCASFVHSTWSSSLIEPRARVFLLLSRPVTGEEYRLAYASVTAKVEAGGFVVDRAASDPSRFWFLPATKHGAPFTCYAGDGPPVDADAAIAAAPRPTAPPPPTPRPLPAGGASPFDRARAYLLRCDPAVSGSGGHRQTFFVAQKLVRGFSLSEGDACALMSEWNQRCVPPWPEFEIVRKVRQAAETGRHAVGDMVERDRPR